MLSKVFKSTSGIVILLICLLSNFNSFSQAFLDYGINEKKEVFHFIENIEFYDNTTDSKTNKKVLKIQNQKIESFFVLEGESLIKLIGNVIKSSFRPETYVLIDTYLLWPELNWGNDSLDIIFGRGYFDNLIVFNYYIYAERTNYKWIKATYNNEYKVGRLDYKKYEILKINIKNSSYGKVGSKFRYDFINNKLPSIVKIEGKILGLKIYSQDQYYTPFYPKDKNNVGRKMFGVNFIDYEFINNYNTKGKNTLEKQSKIFDQFLYIRSLPFILFNVNKYTSQLDDFGQPISLEQYNTGLTLTLQDTGNIKSYNKFFRNEISKPNNKYSEVCLENSNNIYKIINSQKIELYRPFNFEINKGPVLSLIDVINGYPVYKVKNPYAIHEKEGKEVWQLMIPGFGYFHSNIARYANGCNYIPDLEDTLFTINGKSIAAFLRTQTPR